MSGRKGFTIIGFGLALLLLNAVSMVPVLASEEEKVAKVFVQVKCTTADEVLVQTWDYSDECDGEPDAEGTFGPLDSCSSKGRQISLRKEGNWFNIDNAQDDAEVIGESDSVMQAGRSVGKVRKVSQNPSRIAIGPSDDGKDVSFDPTLPVSISGSISMNVTLSETNYIFGDVTMKEFQDEKNCLGDLKKDPPVVYELGECAPVVKRVQGRIVARSYKFIAKTVKTPHIKSGSKAQCQNPITAGGLPSRDVVEEACVGGVRVTCGVDGSDKHQYEVWKSGSIDCSGRPAFSVILQDEICKHIDLSDLHDNRQTYEAYTVLSAVDSTTFSQVEDDQ